MDRNIEFRKLLYPGSTSLSARRAWIEMIYGGGKTEQSQSLSARRAWIEIYPSIQVTPLNKVALRKESVDRNTVGDTMGKALAESLSARRAWIEITDEIAARLCDYCRSPQGERG